MRRHGLAILAVALLTGLLAGCASTSKEGYAKPVNGTITSSFGPRKKSYHTGIDIAADRGTEVRAVRSGRVTFRGRSKRYGRLLIVDHGGGIESYYAHLSRYHVREGQKVKRGQRIGRVGKSGRASGYHLHFELRQNGQPINPAGIVPL